MDFNPYEILQISTDAAIEEIEANYRRLRAKYSEDRFLEGEEGRQGAINLTNLENAYSEIMRIRSRTEAFTQYGSDLGSIDRMIKDGNIEGAQIELDKISDRGAEWHFLQSIIFYKKGWYDESRAQLKLAVNLDPENTKYSTALNKLEQVMASGTSNPYNMGKPQGEQVPPVPPDNSMGLANCCSTLCLLDCCCNMMRCC